MTEEIVTEQMTHHKRAKKPALILTFDTTTQAMAAEKFCTQNKLSGRLVPIPGEITSGCGLAWKTAPEEKETLTNAFKQAGLSWGNSVILSL